MSLAKYIDHTLLKPEAQTAHIESLAEEAITHGFFGICINSRFVAVAQPILEKSSVKLVTVIGFPLGACSIDTKIFETQWCVNHGASEIDTVIPIGALKDRDLNYVRKDLSSVVLAAAGKPVKVIIETHLLSNDEKVLACQLIKESGAQFVKTSTGFTGGGATIEDIKLFKDTIGNSLQIKASGGVKSYDFAVELIRAGASRIGTSSGVQLVSGQKSMGDY